MVGKNSLPPLQKWRPKVQKWYCEVFPYYRALSSCRVLIGTFIVLCSQNESCAYRGSGQSCFGSLCARLCYLTAAGAEQRAESQWSLPKLLACVLDRSPTSSKAKWMEFSFVGKTWSIYSMDFFFNEDNRLYSWKWPYRFIHSFSHYFLSTY